MTRGEGPEVAQKKTINTEHDRVSSAQDLDLRRQKLEAELARRGVLNRPDKQDKDKEDKDFDVPSGTGQAIKISSEFFAGVGVGIVLGLGFDQLVGTSPWGLVVFLLLGFAAGVLNVLRSVGYVAPSQLGQKGAERQKDKADRPK